MSIKYGKIMNTSGLNGKLRRLDAEYHDKLFNLQSVVTEKIHGENCRVGIDECGEFIGQKNQTFYEFNKHPNWDRISDIAKNEIKLIHAYIREMKKLPQYKQKNITFFGELYGKGMRKGFEWDFDNGLRVVWFDIKVNDEYLGYFGPDGKVTIFQTLEIDTIPIVGYMTIKDALELDIENIKSQISLSPYIEGVVIVPETGNPDWWRFSDRLILKYKTKRFDERDKGKHKREKPINNFVSEYVDFVTDARIDHAIQALKERGIKILYKMRDLQHIPKAVIADIELEENDGNPLDKKDRKYLGSYIPKFYKTYLDNMLKEIQRQLNEIKKEKEK